MKRLFGVLILAVAACTGADGTASTASTTTSLPPPTQDPGSATPAPPSTASAQAPSGSSAGTTTTASATNVSILPDGRPATFLAVTTDYEAVEVDTLTGAVIRSFGGRARAGDLHTDELPPNVVDAAWRTTSGSTILISECCEPAAGRINYLGEGDTLSDDYGDPAVPGWAVVTCPTSDQVILVGYRTAITTPDPTAASEQRVFLENDGSGIAAIGWAADGELIHWFDVAAGELVTWDPTGVDGDVIRMSMAWVREDQRLTGLEAQANGRLVSFLHTVGTNFFDIVETEVVTYGAGSGELADRTQIEPGSAFGGYDPTGLHFLYVTADGRVRWIGPDGTHTLAEGFIFASW